MLLHGWEHQCAAALLFWLGWSNTRCRIKSSPYSWLEIQLRFSKMPRTHIALLQSLWLTPVIGSTRKHRVVLQISRGPRALYQMLKALETPGLTFSMKTVTKACKKSGRKEVRKSCWPRKNRQIFWNFVSNRNKMTALSVKKMTNSAIFILGPLKQLTMTFWQCQMLSFDLWFSPLYSCFNHK